MTEQKELRGITLVSTATVTFHFLQPGPSSSLALIPKQWERRTRSAVWCWRSVCCIRPWVCFFFFFFKFAVGFTQMMFWPPCEKVLFFWCLIHGWNFFCACCESNLTNGDVYLTKRKMDESDDTKPWSCHRLVAVLQAFKEKKEKGTTGTLRAPW